MHKSKHAACILSPSLIQDVGDAGGGDSGSIDGKLAGKAVVVELHAGMTILIGYDVGIPYVLNQNW